VLLEGLLLTQDDNEKEYLEFALKVVMGILKFITSLIDEAFCVKDIIQMTLKKFRNSRKVQSSLTLSTLNFVSRCSH
jgi:hypothetical protein